MVLYGAGGNCQFALFTCSFVKSIRVECICDTTLRGEYVYHNACNNDSKPVTYKIISPAELLADYQDAFVCITSWKYEQEIKSTLIQSGFPESQVLFLRNPYIITPEDFQRKYLDGYRWAYEFFEDERSRQKVIDRMRMILLGDVCSADSQFKDGYTGFPGIQLADGEVYIDGGAYVGDTAEEFIQNMEIVGKHYAHIYSFEPDSRNLELAEKNLAQYDNIDLVPKGLWSKPCQICFDSRSGGEYIGSGFVAPLPGSDWTAKTSNMVPVTSLDAFFRDMPENEWPTLIKMDIEGSEKEALTGTAQIIKRKKPRLMICAYHKPEDIYELPQTILSLREDYKLYLWQIGESFWDVILYAL